MKKSVFVFLVLLASACVEPECTLDELDLAENTGRTCSYGWLIEQVVDPIDDRETTTLIRPASEGVAFLDVLCSEGDRVMAFVFSEEGNASDVTVRFDGNDAVTFPASTTESGLGVFVDVSAGRDLVDELEAGAQTTVVRFGSQTETFDVSGWEAAREPHRPSCGL